MAASVKRPCRLVQRPRRVARGVTTAALDGARARRFAMLLCAREAMFRKALLVPFPLHHERERTVAL